MAKHEKTVNSGSGFTGMKPLQRRVIGGQLRQDEIL